MAAPNDPLNDPRWEGLDSQSLPDRPAHPDPSKMSEVEDADKVPSHGIVGHLDAKIGLESDEAVLADRARYHRGVADDLEAEQRVMQDRAEAGDQNAKASLKGLKDSVTHHRNLGRDAKDAPLDPGASVREDVLSGDIKSHPLVDVTKKNQAAESVHPTTEAKHG